MLIKVNNQEIKRNSIFLIGINKFLGNFVIFYHAKTIVSNLLTKVVISYHSSICHVYFTILNYCHHVTYFFLHIFDKHKSCGERPAVIYKKTSIFLGLF